MNLKTITILLVWSLIMSLQDADAQITWYDPMESEVAVISGRLNEEKNYYRLPRQMQNTVRKEVWELSKNTAGLSLGFFTEAPEIQVKYKVRGNLQMPHMPATGVSGLDLFIQKSDANWNWVRGIYDFADTIRYTFKIDQNTGIDKVFRLYLPLYNEVEYLSIGVREGLKFGFIEKSSQAPIIVYGTSIAQGACASRPAMAWTTIVQQELKTPLVNLGFSGNGLLEKEIIDLISEKNASLYILDCLPNLVPGKGISDEEIRYRIQYAARQLRDKNPRAPILFTSHGGYADKPVDQGRKILVNKLNTILSDELEKLIKDGITEIYHLRAEEIGLDQYDFVDGTHPTDRGMFKYAQAYRKKILEIKMNEEK